MRIPTVSRCLFCINLTTAGLIYGVLGVLSSILLVRYDDRIPHLCAVTIHLVWLYGLLKEKSIYMLPYIVLSFIALACLYIVEIFVVVLIICYPQRTSVTRFQSKYGSIVVPFILPIVAFIVALGILTYFWIVLYSTYKHIKDTAQQRQESPEIIVTVKN